jgi:hypothetical protein
LLVRTGGLLALILDCVVMVLFRFSPSPPAAPNFYVDVRRVVLSICSEGIESGLVAAATTSSPFSLVPGGIRQLRFSFGSSEHAYILAVSLASFSPFSLTVSAAGYVFRR